MKMEWKSEFETGVALIDEQHRWLFSLMNRAFEECEGAASPDGIKRVVSELKQYANKHFSEEEAKMQIRPPENLEFHLAQHRFFHSTVDEIIRDADNIEEPKEAALNVLNFLSKWFADHILYVDRNYFDSSGP